MVDTVSRKTRSRMMRGIRQKDTKPELLVRKFLYAEGFRYRLHNPKIPGNPDITLAKYRAVILVHGCFWHRHENCKLAYVPKSRQDFWNAKFERNIARDDEVRRQLRKRNWRLMTVWECALRDDEMREIGLKMIVDWIRSEEPEAEFPSAAWRPT